MAPDYHLDTREFPPILGHIRDALAPHPIYLVGGLVRDALHAAISDGSGPLLSWPRNADMDLTTRGRPDENARRLSEAGFSVIPLGVEHGTVAVVGPRGLIEITTFRSDVDCDGRHCQVEFSDTLEEDLVRRDFTVNALAADPVTGQVLDPLGGIADLAARRIRTVGDPRVRFSEDHLRILRAVRFAARLEFELEAETRAAMTELAPRLSDISAERIRDEFLKILVFPEPSHAFRLMHETDILAVILPELDACFGVDQNQWHSHDVGEHSLLAMDALARRFPFLRFVALLHDIGKPGAKQWIDEKGDYVFYGHENTGAEMAKDIFERLRFSRRDCEHGVRLIAEHMINLSGDVAPKTLRRYMNRLGRDFLWDLIRLRVADRKGNLKKAGLEPGLPRMLRLYREIARAEDAVQVGDLVLGGDDLVSLGIEPGPVFREILEWLLSHVLDDPLLNEREALLTLLRQSPYGALIRSGEHEPPNAGN